MIVLLSAFSLGQMALDPALVAAFSVGLAARLSAVGLTCVLGRSVIEAPGRRP